MHLSGKIFAWLLIPLILAAMVFSAKLVRVRNSYTAKLEKSKREFNEAAPKLDEARATLNHEQAEWHRATQTWGRSDIVADTNIQNPATGQLTVVLGAPLIQDKQWLYGFELQPDGSSIYRGDFVADTVREGQSILKPNWRIRPGDTEGWKTGKWRWRTFLPSAYPNQIDEYEQALLQKDELLEDRVQTLDIQQQLIAAATDQLKMREAELLGGEQLPQDQTLDVEFRKGLVAAMEELEEERNGELIAVDRLRRSVRDLRKKIESVQEENRDLVRKLPQPATEVTRKP